jgi:hypothetical protein
MNVLGLDLGHANVPEAEHWLADLPAVLGHPAGLIACTHLVHGPRARVVLTLVADGPIDLSALPARPPADDHPGPDDAALKAAEDHTARRAGRAVHYPGVDTLTGTVTVADLLARGAIERIVVLGSAESPAADTLVDTRSFVRPQWMDGRLTLVTMPAPDGRIAPFEVPNPTPCCAVHH